MVFSHRCVGAFTLAGLLLGSAGAHAQDPQATVPAPAEPAKKPDPFAFADFTWLTGNPRTKDSPLDSKVFTGEFRADTNYTYSFNKPQDDTIVGSSEIFRSGEVQVTQLGLGGDFHGWSAGGLEAGGRRDGHGSGRQRSTGFEHRSNRGRHGG